MSVDAGSRLNDLLRPDDGPRPRYACLVEIGSGGMAQVFRAWDTRMDREVALKVARPEAADDPELRRRFEEEIRLAGNLSHPNILPIYERESYEGRPALSMPIVDGASLDRAGTDLRAALGHLRTAAEALHYAHEKGVVHRDLKPSNILVGKDGRVFLADFGIARQTSSGERLTLPGIVVGTPAYMSPEQARGEDADARSDVYSLGATLYELATGRPPFAGADPAAVLEAVRSRVPAPARKVNPRLSRNVAAILRMAMERRPEDRYLTAQAFADDIALYLRHERPKARGRGLPYWVLRFLRRHPVRAAAFLLVALLAGGALFLGALVFRASRQHAAALRETDAVRRRELLERAAPYFPAARARLAELLQEETERREAQLKATADLIWRANEALDALELARAEDLIREVRLRDEGKAASLRDRLDKLKRAASREVLLAQAEARLREGDLEAARRTIEVLDSDDPRRREIHEKIVQRETERRLGSLERAAEAGDARAFEELLPSSGPDPDARMARAARQLGLVLAGRSDGPGAIRWLEEAERRGQKDAELFRERGRARIRTGDLDAAGRDLDGFLTYSPSGAVPPREYWSVWHHRAVLAGRRGDWNAALQALSKAHALEPSNARLLHDAGLARYRATRRPDLALGELGRALDLDADLRLDADYGPILLAFADEKSRDYPRLPDADARDTRTREVLDWMDRVAGRLSAPDPAFRLERARLFRRLGNYGQARAETALAGGGPAGDLAHARILVAWSFLPQADRGVLDEALDYASRAVRGAPGDSAALACLGLVQARLRIAEAKGNLERSARGGGLFPVGRLELARLHRADSRFDGARAEAERVLAGEDGLEEDDLLWSGAETLRQPYAAARAELRRGALSLRAEARLRLGDAPGCVDDCTRLLEERETAELLLLRGRAYRSQGRPKDRAAMADFEAANRLDPDSPAGYRLLGTVFLDLENWEEAVKAYTQALERSRPKPGADLYAFRGYAHKQLSNTSQRKTDFRQAWALLEESPDREIEDFLRRHDR